MEIVRQGLRTEIVVNLRLDEVPSIVRGGIGLTEFQKLIRAEALRAIEEIEEIEKAQHEGKDDDDDEG